MNLLKPHRKGGNPVERLVEKNGRNQEKRKHPVVITISFDFQQRNANNNTDTHIIVTALSAFPMGTISTFLTRGVSI